MAKKRKHKKSDFKNLTPTTQSTKNISQNSSGSDSLRDGKTADKNKQSEQERTVAKKTSISIPVFFSGLFLSLLLGIYIGTLFPEFARNAGNNEMQKTAEPVLEKEIGQAGEVKEQMPSPQLPSAYQGREKELINKLAADSKQEKLWIELGDLYFDNHMPEQSINAYSHALSINPANPDVLTDMGVMYREKGDFDKALDCFKNAYGIRPDHIQSRYNEGIVLANDLHKHNEAKKAWQELLRYKPNAVSPNGTPVRQLIEEQAN